MLVAVFLLSDDASMSEKLSVQSRPKFQKIVHGQRNQVSKKSSEVGRKSSNEAKRPIFKSRPKLPKVVHGQQS
jgi:hypothetical protein